MRPAAVCAPRIAAALLALGLLFSQSAAAWQAVAPSLPDAASGAESARLQAHARAAEIRPEGTPPRISILTFGPGPIYWQRFGHNAIVVRHRGRALVYNYGFFDFSQEHFFARFIRGEMEYRLAVQSLADTLAHYRWEGREVREQVLDLTPAQAHALHRFLQWNARPENAAYRYDYFLAACSTRIRDELDVVTGGALSRFMHDVPARLNLRQQVLRLTAPDVPLMLGLDLILGPAADAPRSLWEESFVPEVLASALTQATREGTDSGRVPLVQHDRLLLRQSPERAAEAPKAQPPALRAPFAATGLALAALLLLAARVAPPLWLGLAGVLLLAAGAAGLIMVFITVGTAHWAGWYNLSAAYYNPLAWLVFPALWRVFRGREPAGWQRVLTALLPAVALLGLAGAFWQDNLHHGLLWLPLHAALAWTLLRGLATRRGRAS